MRHGHTIAALLCASALAGCSGGRSTGTVSVSLMDRPVDGVLALFVTIDQVWIKPQGDGPAFQLPMTSTPLTVDLLAHTDENAAIIVDEAVVDAGTYNWVEFRIDDTDITKSYAITDEGGQVLVDIDVPSDRIRLVSGFTVGENQAVRFLFDWRVDTGLTEAVGRNLYILKPAFRILSADAYGTVSGKLTGATAAANPDCSGSTAGKVVYLFEGDVTPDDQDGADPEPVTTVDAEFDPLTGDYPYRVAAMPGDYTLALTCLGEEETPLGDEDLMFLSPIGGGLVTVTAETAVENVDF